MQELSKLPFEEKLQLVWDLWDSIEGKDTIPVSNETKAELQRRLDEYDRDGIKGDTWEVVRKRIEAKL